MAQKLPDVKKLIRFPGALEKKLHEVMAVIAERYDYTAVKSARVALPHFTKRLPDGVSELVKTAHAEGRDATSARADLVASHQAHAKQVREHLDELSRADLLSGNGVVVAALAFALNHPDFLESLPMPDHALLATVRPAKG